MSKRLYFDLYYPLVAELDIGRAAVLMGPRGVGKTVMMFQTIDQLINEKVHLQGIFLLVLIIPFMLIWVYIG